MPLAPSGLDEWHEVASDLRVMETASAFGELFVLSIALLEQENPVPLEELAIYLQIFLAYSFNGFSSISFVRFLFAIYNSALEVPLRL